MRLKDFLNTDLFKNKSIRFALLKTIILLSNSLANTYSSTISGIIKHRYGVSGAYQADYWPA